MARVLVAVPDDPVILYAEVNAVPLLDASTEVGPDAVVLRPPVCSVLVETVIDDTGVILCETVLLEVDR